MKLGARDLAEKKAAPEKTYLLCQLCDCLLDAQGNHCYISGKPPVEQVETAKDAHVSL